VLDSAMERVMKLNIKVDVLLGDFDRDFDANYYKEHQHPIEIVHTPDQSKTDLEKLLITFMKENCCGKCCLGYRKTHGSYITNLTNIVRYREKLEIVILDDHSKVFYYLRNSKNGIQQTPIFRSFQ
jgi:thiamine pyrophosphokinase